MEGREAPRKMSDREIDEHLRPYEEATARLMLEATARPTGDPLGLLGDTVGRYRIESVLGAGGMGVLYRATDVRLLREVALKFLPPAFSLDENAKRRFLREARAASSLDHPNVCTIYAADETSDGRLYIAMACYEGMTLRERLERGPVEPDEAVELLLQAARGLAAAHAVGLVHRDIKPANLFLTSGGILKILDFGIARMPGSSVTDPDQRPGTRAYMAPEQARGGSVDGRADIWSLGLVLHEMLTGARFAPRSSSVPGEEAPKPLPAELESLLDRMLQRDPASRPTAKALSRLSSSDLAIPVDDAGASSDDDLRTRRRAVAVLPFADLSPAGDQDYFCEGMAEELLDALARIEGLRVASRLTFQALRELPADPRAVGRRLDVGTLVDGSVRKAASRIRVTARLVRVADGSILWSDRYDRELEDVFAIQEDIARSVAGALRLTLGGEPLATLRAARTTHAEAYEAYLKGRQLFLRDTRRDLQAARRMFARAVEVDTSYARGYAGLADALSFLYKHFERDPDLLAGAEEASRTAIQLDPESADAHTSRAVVHWLQGRLSEAAAEFETAVDLDPASFEAHYLCGMFCWGTGRTKRGIEAFRAAAEQRPDDFQSPNLLAALCRAEGRDAEARAAFERGLELTERHLALNPNNVRARYHAGFALVGLGRASEGVERARGALEMAPRDAMVLYNVAGVHAVAGRTEDGLDYLEQAIEEGFSYRPDLLYDPDLANLRGRPRFRALLDRLSARNAE